MKDFQLVRARGNSEKPQLQMFRNVMGNTPDDIKRVEEMTPRVKNLFSQGIAGCNSKLTDTMEAPAGRQTIPLHQNQLKIITSQQTRGDRNHNWLSLTSLWFFERLESHILLREKMNSSLCQRAVNTGELIGSAYKEHSQQPRKTR